MKKILFAILIAMSSINMFAQDNSSETTKRGIEFEPFIATNLGATTSLSVPEETEKIYGSKFLYTPAIGVYATKMLGKQQKWGISMGAIFERKGGNSKVEMRNFETEIVLAGSDGTPTHGYFTGTSTNHHSVWYVTVPVRCVYRFNRLWDVSAGLYFSYAAIRTRTGEAYDGKIRTSPLVPAIAVEYSTSDWSNKIPRFDMGVQLGMKHQIWKNLDCLLDVNWGLLNTLDAPESGLKANVYNLYACLGLGWRF